MEFQDVKPGIQKVSLKIQELYKVSKELNEFKERLSSFLKSPSDPHNSKIVKLKNEQLVYQTECIIPEKQDSRVPLLVLLGNPASHSVYSEMFFSFERKGQEHRFWKAFKNAGILKFTEKSSYAKDLAERNQSRKKELYDLSYKSKFRIGLATFYSMPSGASKSNWAGATGLRKLFGKKALMKIASCEKSRIAGLIANFLSPQQGVVFAFQKDAYVEIKSPESPKYDFDKVKQEGLEGVSQCDPNVRLFCLPPTRFMYGKKALYILRKYRCAVDRN